MEENKKEPIEMCFFCKNKNICKSTDILTEKYDDIMKLLKVIGPELNISCDYRQDIRYKPCASSIGGPIFPSFARTDNCFRDDRGLSGSI